MRGNQVIISTTDALEGRPVEAHLGVVTAHIVAGTGLFSDAFASFSDVFGGRSHSYQKQLASINDEALALLKKKAAARGANCIVGLKIDHDEVSGSGKSMFMVTTTGTAVVVSAREEKDQSVSGATRAAGAGVLSAEELDRQIKKKNIIASVEKADDLFWLEDKHWLFLCDNQIGEVAPHILRTVEKCGKRGLSPAKDEFVDRSKQYFLSLPEDVAKPHLYDGLRHSAKRVWSYALDLLQERKLLDLEEASSLLDADELLRKKQALEVLRSHKPAYTREDVGRLEALRKKVKNAFPERGQEVEVSRTFSSKKKKRWECECGRQNKLDERYCVSCNRDIRGLSPGEVKPAQIIALIDKRLEVLNEGFSR